MPRKFPLAVLLMLGALVPAYADHKADCIRHKDHDVRLKSCSEMVKANPADAAAYYHRASAYRAKGDADRALSDYNMSIELNPSHAAAYEDRAIVLVGKGDYTRAVADVTRAAELKKEAMAKPVDPRSKASRSRAKTKVTVTTKAFAIPLSSTSLSAPPTPKELPSWARTIDGQI